jgi:hypothetical protein
MAPPKGNKYGLGNHNAGRPKRTSYDQYNIDDLGKEMVEWVKANNPLMLSEFYIQQKGILRKDWDVLHQLDAFQPYYEKAIDIVRLNYTNGRVHNSIAQRFLRLFFPELAHREDKDHAEKVEREEAIKAKYAAAIITETHQQAINALKPLLQQLKDRQTQAFEARKTLLMINNNESQS